MTKQNKNIMKWHEYHAAVALCFVLPSDWLTDGVTCGTAHGFRFVSFRVRSYDEKWVGWLRCVYDMHGDHETRSNNVWSTDDDHLCIHRAVKIRLNSLRHSTMLFISNVFGYEKLKQIIDPLQLCGFIKFWGPSNLWLKWLAGAYQWNVMYLLYWNESDRKCRQEYSSNRNQKDDDLAK